MPLPAAARRLLRALNPAPHFMSFAPLDVWARLLRTPGVRPQWPYLPRLAGTLAVSALATLVTLPERLLTAPRFPRRPPPAPDAPPEEVSSFYFPKGAPDVVAILGYYRSGTTHLQYLMSCDPRMRTPRWVECTAPTGDRLSWWLIRLILVPFLSNNRPQDDVAFGPDYPAEDDFATNNDALASPLPGRFVFPSAWGHFSRFHALDGLTPAELHRWRASTARLVRKLARGSGGRRILLKSPTHTARVAELVRLFGLRPDGTPRVRFVHISREPLPTYRSNLALHERLQVFNFEDAPPPEEVRSRVAQEYLDTERRFLAEAEALPPGTLARVRFQDLVADPEAELPRIYGALGLGWSEDLAERMRLYLHRVRDYKTAEQKRASEAARRPSRSDLPAEAAASVPLDPRLEQLRALFGHDRPALPKREPRPPREIPPDRPRYPLAFLGGPAIAALVVACWIGAGTLIGTRLDSLSWIAGIAIGAGVILLARNGSRLLGVWALLLFIAAASTHLVLGTHLINGWAGNDLVRAVRTGLGNAEMYIGLFLGGFSAYRYPTRQHLKPPGL